ncbi:MAG: hypothetical protein H0V92_05845 [Pseudonocardiales bacterium]|nr:hypothetical protein [Pseudonocardiales bacterium]
MLVLLLEPDGMGMGVHMGLLVMAVLVFVLHVIVLVGVVDMAVGLLAMAVFVLVNTLMAVILRHSYLLLHLIC